jgi:hypothetical protein
MRGWNAAVALITGCSVTFWASHKPDLEKSNTLRPREMGQGRVPESSSYGSSTCSDVKGKEKPIVHSGSLAFLRPLCQICRAKKCSPFPTGAMFARVIVQGRVPECYVRQEMFSFSDWCYDSGSSPWVIVLRVFHLQWCERKRKTHRAQWLSRVSASIVPDLSCQEMFSFSDWCYVRHAIEQEVCTNRFMFMSWQIAGLVGKREPEWIDTPSRNMNGISTELS